MDNWKVIKYNTAREDYLRVVQATDEQMSSLKAFWLKEKYAKMLRFWKGLSEYEKTNVAELPKEQ